VGKFHGLVWKNKVNDLLFVSLKMQGNTVATIAGYLIPTFSFVFSKDMDNLWNY
jgi:hypothetical protein